MDVGQEKDDHQEGGLQGGPGREQTTSSARTAAARSQDTIKPILLLIFNLGQPQDQPNDNDAAESAENATLAGQV